MARGAFFSVVLFFGVLFSSAAPDFFTEDETGDRPVNGLLPEAALRGRSQGWRSP